MAGAEIARPPVHRITLAQTAVLVPLCLLLLAFDEVRAYQPGDPFQAIDWKVTARMGKPFIKKFVEERELTVILLVDFSASGQFGTRRQFKREIEAEILTEVHARVERDYEPGHPGGIAVGSKGWHPGVIGIVASRIKDRLHRPTIAFADGDEGQVKGSARSIEGLHIRDALDALSGPFEIPFLPDTQNKQDDYRPE